MLSLYLLIDAAAAVERRLQRARETTMHHPGPACLLAVLAGYVAGRMLARTRRC